MDSLATIYFRLRLQSVPRICTALPPNEIFWREMMRKKSNLVEGYSQVLYTQFFSIAATRRVWLDIHDLRGLRTSPCPMTVNKHTISNIGEITI